jgi:hypothetical protein
MHSVYLLTPVDAGYLLQCRMWYADAGMRSVEGSCDHFDVVLGGVLDYACIVGCICILLQNLVFMHTVISVECVDTLTISCTHEFVCFSLVHAIRLGVAGHAYMVTDCVGVWHLCAGVYACTPFVTGAWAGEVLLVSSMAHVMLWRASCS